MERSTPPAGPSPRGTRTDVAGRTGSHPEHAELRRCDRRVQRRGEREAEHAARVGRVDDAVVPETGAGVVGMALVLVLLEQRRLEGPLLLGRPGAAPRL